MPQLTAEFDRVTVYSLTSTDAEHFSIENNLKVLLMVQEIRIAQDYSHSDIIILDLANYTMAHAAKFSLAVLKKYEMCVLVSALVIRNILIELQLCD